MGEILGIGVTHYPGLIQPDEAMAGLLNRTLNSDQVRRRCRSRCHAQTLRVVETVTQALL